MLTTQTLLKRGGVALGSSALLRWSTGCCCAAAS